MYLCHKKQANNKSKIPDEIQCVDPVFLLDEVECCVYVQMLFLLSRNSELLGHDVHFKYFPVYNPQLIIRDNVPNNVGKKLFSLV
jgi:hypothetical protein